MTIEQNRAEAARIVRQSMGLADRLPNEWTYAERTAYNKALASYVAARPEQFSALDNAMSVAISNQQYTALEDASFDWGEFAAETAAPLGNALKSVGDGVFTVANAAKWAIPLLAVLAVVIIAEKLSGGTAISSVKKLAK